MSEHQPPPPPLSSTSSTANTSRTNSANDVPLLRTQLASNAASSSAPGSREASGDLTMRLDSGEPRYRLPELAEAMKQTVSYGGCEVSPIAAYRRIDLPDEPEEPKTSQRSSRSSKTSTSSKKYNCQFDGGGGRTSARGNTLILRFDANGAVSFQEMSRMDVLRMTQEAARPKRHDSFASVDTQGDEEDQSQEELRPARTVMLGGTMGRRGSRRISEPRVMDCAKIVDVQGVHARDIRKLDNMFAVSNEPSIIVRKQAIIMNADPLRAVIMRNVCLVFVPDGADSLLSNLREKFLEHAHPEATEQPFELSALEALLATICRHFEHEYEKTAPVVSKALDRLAHGKIATAELETLRSFKNSMNEFESQVNGVRRALMDILDNEEDLRLLHLSKLYDEPSLLTDLYSFDSEDVEVLIENYLQDIYSTRTKANLMQHRIQNTESLVMLKLDSMRNYLLGVELIFTLVAISISVGTYITGAFGMNLNSHLQEEEGWFWGVVIFTLIVFITSTVTGVLFFRKKGVLG
ncbi:hypothetical protein Poli38472_002164 [Pythium oligandrum]|uniref:Magnesium transporter n=1 Tax=Pythium oligandrum TaxID=41045 RepID=A0A8K1FM12_PYTOL|nr:hypothetical protein Poli38472_002164 [Pythium oligandrum]|eukprot:TMW63223.1 hypothetical protein Poli38472_002164 [Pythium oligandrum]